MFAGMMPSSFFTTSMLLSLGTTCALIWRLTRTTRSLSICTAQTSCSSGKSIPLLPLAGQCSSAAVAVCLLLKQALQMLRPASTAAHFACCFWPFPQSLSSLPLHHDKYNLLQLAPRHSCAYRAAVAATTHKYAHQFWVFFCSSRMMLCQRTSGSLVTAGFLVLFVGAALYSTSMCTHTWHAHALSSIACKSKQYQYCDVCDPLDVSDGQASVACIGMQVRSEQHQQSHSCWKRQGGGGF